MTFFAEVPEPRSSSGSGRSASPWARILVVLAVVVTVVGAAVWLMSDDARSEDSPIVKLFPGLLAPPPELSPELADLAGRMHLTPEGRDVFARTLPRFAAAAEVADVCGRSSHGDDDGSTLGCFTGLGDARSEDRILIYRPADERLASSIVSVAAHELLHAVYVRMTTAEQERVSDLLTAAVARIAADDPVHEQIAASVGDDHRSLATEQFAYLGSQIRLDVTFDAELEEVYARTFADRTALVDTHDQAVALLDEVRASVEQGWAEVAAAEQANAQARAQLDADEAGYAAALSEYESDLAEFEATSVDERPRWRVTLTPVNGRPLTMSWEDSLDYRRNELDRLAAEQRTRRGELESAETTATQLRAETQALHDDAVALLRDAYPGQDFEPSASPAR